MALDPYNPVLLFFKIKLSKTQYSPHKYLARLSQPLKAILFAVKSNTLNLLFSNKCSVIVYIASPLIFFF